MGLSETMTEALRSFASTGGFGSVRSTTIQALERRGMVQRLDGGAYELAPDGKAFIASESAAAPRTVKYSTNYTNRAFAMTPTLDPGQADYAFWDRARKGLIRGMEASGAFLKPLASKVAAWSFGILPDIQVDNTSTYEKIGGWLADNHAKLLRAYEESVALGDYFIVVNADLTMTIVPPHVVEPIVDDSDYSRPIGWRITEVYEHPSQDVYKRMVIEDAYTAEGRVRTIWIDGQQQSQETYPNLLDGRIPVVHIANNVAADERFGHPEALALLAILYWYNDVLEHAIAGNKKQGRPTPVIEKMGTQDHVEAFWQRFGRRRESRDPDTGETIYEYVLDFDADRVLTLGGDAQFSWKSPGSFAGDTEALLGLLFYLMLQNTEIPEFVWGNAIASSKASAESQMEPFDRFISKKQGGASGWLLEVLRTVVAYTALYEPSVRADDQLHIRWPSLVGDDKRLTLDAIKLGLEQQLLDDETALSLMPLNIENPRDVLEKLRQQIEVERDDYDRRQEQLMMRIRDESEERDDAEEDDENDGGTNDEAA